MVDAFAPELQIGINQGKLIERESILYKLKTMREDLLDKSQAYNQLGQEREMFACKLAARYILGAIEEIKEK